MKKLLWFPLLCSLAFGQGVTVGPKTTIGPRTGIGIAGGPSFVQAANIISSSGHPDLTPTFGAGTAAGSSVLIYGAWAVTSAPTMASSNVTVAGGTCLVLDSVTDAGLTANALYLCTGVTPGTTTATLNLTSDATMNAAASIANAVIIAEIHNTSAKDGSAHAANSAGNTTTNGEVCGSGFTTLTSNDLIVFGITDRASINNTTWTAGTSPITFAIPTNAQVSNKLIALEYGTQSAAGAIIPAITANSTDNYDPVCAGLK